MKFFRDLDYGLCSMSICSMFLGAQILKTIISPFQMTCLFAPNSVLFSTSYEIEIVTFSFTSLAFPFFAHLFIPIWALLWVVFYVFGIMEFSLASFTTMEFVLFYFSFFLWLSGGSQEDKWIFWLKPSSLNRKFNLENVKTRGLCDNL